VEKRTPCTIHIICEDAVEEEREKKKEKHLGLILLTFKEALSPLILVCT
jgi:hypothetical protein